MAMGPSTLALSPSGLPGYSPPVGCGLAPTIRHNVTMGDLGLEDDDARFWAAIRACGLEADLAGWPSLRGRPRWGGAGIQMLARSSVMLGRAAPSGGFGSDEVRARRNLLPHPGVPSVQWRGPHGGEWFGHREWFGRVGRPLTANASSPKSAPGGARLLIGGLHPPFCPKFRRSNEMDSLFGQRPPENTKNPDGRTLPVKLISGWWYFYFR